MTDQSTISVEDAKPLFKELLEEQAQKAQAELKQVKEDAVAAAKDARVATEEMKGRLESGDGDAAEFKKESSEKWEDLDDRLSAQAEKVDKLLAKADEVGSETKRDEAHKAREKAENFFRQKDLHDVNDVDERRNWKAEEQVNDDRVEAFKIYEALTERIMRTPRAIERIENIMTPEEAKAFAMVGSSKKSMDTGQTNMFWMQPAVENLMLECFDSRTDITSEFSSRTIGTNKWVASKKDDIQSNAKWRCELDCKPNVARFVLPGMIEIEPEELYCSAAATHEIIEDATQDVQGWIATELAKDFSDRQNETWIKGNQLDHEGTQTNGRIRGLLEHGITVMESTVANSFHPDDLLNISNLLIDRYEAGAKFWLSRSFRAHCLTAKDANNNYLFRSLQEGGRFAINGYENRRVSQLAEFADTSTSPAAVNTGGIPCLFGNFKEAYMVIRRLGMALERDPYAAPVCGVVWHARMRIGGGPLCNNAVHGLQIRA